MPSSEPFQSRSYLITFGAVTAAAVGLAFIIGDRDMGFAAAILGLYVLHLYSVRTLVAGQREQWEAVQELEGLVGELHRAEAAAPGDAPPGSDIDEDTEEAGRRHFALGTVAIIRSVLRPEEVSKVLVEQRRRPEMRFGELALEMGLLEEDELERLLEVQREGRFSKAEIRLARRRLETWHEKTRSG